MALKFFKCDKHGLVKHKITHQCELCANDDIYIAALKRAKELLNEAINCANNGNDKNVCPQCREAIVDFLSTAPKT